MTFVIPVAEPGYRPTVALFLVVSARVVLMARTARRYQEAKFFLASIVESSDDAIVTKNLDGIIQSWNGGQASSIIARDRSKSGYHPDH